MSKLPDFIVTISIDATGDVTKRPWPGEFKVKLLLSHADRMTFERKYRELLPNDSQVKDDVKFQASVLAELSVRVIDGPEWWESSKKGMNLVDFSPLYELMKAINEQYEGWLKKVEELAQKEALG